MTVAQTLFSRAIDYAGLFPPAGLAMPDALAEYDIARNGPHAWMLGRFVVPLSRMTELLEALSEGTPRALSVIIDTAQDARTWFARTQSALGRLAEVRREERGVRIEALEVPLPVPQAARETLDAPIAQFGALCEQTGLRDLPIYIEFPRDAAFAERLPAGIKAVLRARMHAKIRCGSVDPSAVPSPAELAAFLDEAAAADVAFKATAGLHHPVRARNGDAGYTMHGFLNLLVATLCARARAPRDMIEAAVSEEDAAAFRVTSDAVAWRASTWDDAAVTLMRDRGFVAFGSCSFEEPVADLTQLGIALNGRAA